MKDKPPYQPVFDEYEEFLKKFERKKTPDDCYTPENIFDAVADWASRRYGFDKSKIVRPFWPGSDYRTERYQDGCVVVDNPPFSILAKICQFYMAHGIHFFLFAPGLSAITTKGAVNAVCVKVNITYENGACVATSFVTDFGDNALESAPDLYRTLKKIDDENRKKTNKKVRKLYFPSCVATAARTAYLSVHGVKYELKRADAVYSGKACGVDVFGGCFLLNERAAAEHAAAERAAAEHAAAERAEEERAAAEKKELSADDKLLLLQSFGEHHD